MKITLISLLNARLSTSLSYMHKLSLYEKEINSSYLHLPMSQASRLTNRDKDVLANFCRDSDIVGISLMTNYFNLAVEITKLIKAKTMATVIWGGVHPQVASDESLEYADFVYLGDADNQYYIDFLRNPNRSYPYILSKANKSLKKEYVLTSNLDALPIINFQEPNFYVYDNGNIHSMPDELNIRKKYIGNVYYLVSSRGCPYSCTYCCNNIFKKNNPVFNKIRKMSVKRLIEGIKEVIGKNYFINEIHFGDDDFCTRTIEELEEFNTLWKQEIKLPFFPCAIPKDALNEEKMHLLIDAGMKYLEIGVQAGSERIRKKLFKRPESNEVMGKVFEKVRGYKGLNSRFDFILDNPWETEAESLETLNMIMMKNPEVQSLIVFFPLLFIQAPIFIKKG